MAKNLSNLTNFVETSGRQAIISIIKSVIVVGKFKNLFKGRHGKFAWFVLVTSVVFLVLWLVGPGNTIILWVDSAVEVRRQQKQIEYYEKSNDEMARRLEMLRTDRDTLEKFAREQFNFAVPGEDVYIIER